MADLPKIRYIVPSYKKKIAEEIKGQHPYNLLTRGRAVDIHWIMNHMPLPEDASILEFGAWPADNWRVAADRWSGLTVTDSFGWQEDRDLPGTPTREEWERLIREAGLAVGKVDVQTMDETDRWDGIFSVSVLEHVIDDDKGLTNIFRALKPGGLFVFTAEMNPYVGLPYVKEIFFRVYKQSDLIAKLRAVGFEVNEEAEDFSSFDDQFRVAQKNIDYLRQPYKHFASAGIVARKPNAAS